MLHTLVLCLAVCYESNSLGSSCNSNSSTEFAAGLLLADSKILQDTETLPRGHVRSLAIRVEA